MPFIFYISYIALWILLIVLSILVLLLYRHFGLIALGTIEGVQRDGLPVGEEAPPISGVTTKGEEIEWIPASGYFSFLAFVAPDCTPCANILPFINQVALTNRSIQVILIASGPQEVVTQLLNKYNLSSSALCLADNGSGAADQYRVRVTPFAFMVNNDGRVLAKGLCDNKTRLEQLLQAGGQESSFLEVTTTHSI
jgi:methylamine dehydrogenase accessory protein MauD